MSFSLFYLTKIGQNLTTALIKKKKKHWFKTHFIFLGWNHHVRDPHSQREKKYISVFKL
jgi:hypothetical protein